MQALYGFGVLRVFLRPCAAGVISMEIATLTRVFIYNGMRLADPGTDMSPAQVKDFYATMYGELTTAEVTSAKEVGNELEYTFRKTTGTKGRKPVIGETEVQIPFAERLQAAAKSAEAEENKMAGLSSSLYRCLLEGGAPLAMPSAAVPLFL